MSSSYVEVRESENGTGGGLLNFQLNDCESNGIDIQTHLDGEPPKDHTYNKDPCIDQPAENNVEESEDEETPKRIGRSPRNIKHKFIKPRNEVRTPVKKETPKKSARMKASFTPSESDDEKAKNTDVDNSINEPESAKKRNRKRKVDEDQTPEVMEETKQSRKKRAKASPEQEVDLSESKNEEEEEEENAKEESPAKKSKGGKARVSKKSERISEPRTPKREVVVETPKSKMKSVKKDVGATSPDLPPGWTRKVVERKSGKTAGMFDVYIYNPEGTKFRSKPELASYLEKIKSSLRADDFSFKRTPLVGVRSPAVEKKSAVKTPKASKSESPDSSKKKSRRSSVGTKKVVQLKVKIPTPKKHTPISKGKKTPTVGIDSKPSTSGLQSKRTGANRKKKNE